MIPADTFRDSFLCSLSVSYDWQRSKHSVDICVAKDDGPSRTYRITGLSDYNISENFLAMYIEQCTLTIEAGRVYLSLDPHLEGTESERDNFTFTGSEIGAVA